MPIVRKSPGKMNAPNGPETPRGPSRPEVEAELLKEGIRQLRVREAPRRKPLLGW
jgi:hypothetical protein